MARDTADGTGGTTFFITNLSMITSFLTLSRPSCHVWLSESHDLDVRSSSACHGVFS